MVRNMWRGSCHAINKLKEEGDLYGKIIILSVENEDDIYNVILKAISNHKNFEMCNYFQDEEIIQAGALKMDVVQRTVLINNIEIRLSNIEFEILYLLANNPGRVFSKEQIYDIVWQEPYSGDYNIVMSHIRHIRKKIEDNPGKPLYIQTVWGIGYWFNKNLSSSL